MDTSKTVQFSAALLHPRYWLTWLTMGLWWSVSQLPYRMQMALGHGAGVLSYRFAKRRSHIIRTNLELCFPELSEQEREAWVKENCIATTKGLFESGMTWFSSNRRLLKFAQRHVRFSGEHHLEAALEKGNGVLLLVMHFTTVEILNMSMNQRFPEIDRSYRPHANPVFEWIQGRQRLRQPNTRAIAAGDVRGIVRSMRDNRTMGYLPDQDYGAKHSVFAPLFGVQAATVLAMARLVKMSKATVVPVVNTRLPGDSGYTIELLPPFENYPTGDDVEDATILNQYLEQEIKKRPTQYLWAHRRFKSRPEGEPDLYGLKKKKRKRKRKS